MQGTSDLLPQFYKQPLQHSGSYRPFPPSGLDWILLHCGIGLFYAKKINLPDPLLTAVTLEASLLRLCGYSGPSIWANILLL